MPPVRTYGSALLIGRGLIEEVAGACRDTPLRLRTLLLAEGAAVPAGVHALVTLVGTRDVLRRVAGVENGDGLDAVAELDAPPLLAPGEAQARAARRVLLLDGVQDPGNLGTLLRSALAFGW
jgi:TrmH family RNA methyltransferase